MAGRRRRRSAGRRTRRSGSGLAWLAAGLATGLLLAGLLWLRMEPAAPPVAPATRPAVPPAPATPADVPTPEGADRERFQFYDLLPRQEVIVPRAGESPRTPAGRPAVPVPGPGQYMLQAGSFRRHADADSVKARLAMLGIQASIEPVMIEGSEFHRVRIGPLRDPAEVERLRQRLQREQIDVFVQRVGD